MTDRSIDYRVAQIVSEIGDPLMRHFYSRITADKELIDAVVMTMVHAGCLRMKEDNYDHDWSYRLTERGREIYGL